MSIGILILHGFTGDTSEVALLAEAFRKRGYRVESPQFRGHGLDRGNLKKATWRMWVQDAEKLMESCGAAAAKW